MFQEPLLRNTALPRAGLEQLTISLVRPRRIRQENVAPLDVKNRCGSAKNPVRQDDGLCFDPHTFEPGAIRCDLIPWYGVILGPTLQFVLLNGPAFVP